MLMITNNNIFFPFHELSIFSLQSLNKIIQRDFFPELPKLRAQHEYLDAVEHNDVEKLREISARYQVTQTPGGRLGRNSISCSKYKPPKLVMQKTLR